MGLSQFIHFHLADWDNELVCYKSEDLTCTWLPVPSAPNTINDTIFLKCIWIAANYTHCVKGKNISVTPSKGDPKLLAKERLICFYTEENTVACQLVNYPDILAPQPSVVPVGRNAVNVTISNLNSMSSYIVQLRCTTKDGLECVCVWSKDILVPHKLTNKTKISHNMTTEIPSGRRSVLLKWEVTQNENILGYYVNVERIPNRCRGSSDRIFLKDRIILLNISMAYYRVNISAYNKAGESPQAICIVPDLPGQIHVKHEGTNAVVIWTPEYSPQCFVVDWGTNNFQPYKLYKMIHASDVCQWESFTRHEKTFRMTHFYSVEGTVTHNSSTTSYHLTGLKKKNIYCVGISGFTNADEGPTTLSQPFSTPKYGTTNGKPLSKPLLQALSDNYTTILFVIELESKTLWKLDLVTDGDGSKCDMNLPDKPSNNTDISLRHEENPEGAVTSEEEIISFTVPLLGDYTSMKVRQKAVMSQAVKLPERPACPHLEIELSSKPPQAQLQVLFPPQDYIKQSQVVFLPSRPTLTGQVNTD
ncbi:LOW QUALITY PROTEIN: uncharacterized protein LRP34_012011 [Phaethornis superciliosus]